MAVRPPPPKKKTFVKFLSFFFFFFFSPVDIFLLFPFVSEEKRQMTFSHNSPILKILTCINFYFTILFLWAQISRQCNPNFFVTWLLKISFKKIQNKAEFVLKSQTIQPFILLAHNTYVMHSLLCPHSLIYINNWIAYF